MMTAGPTEADQEVESAHAAPRWPPRSMAKKKKLQMRKTIIIAPRHPTGEQNRKLWDEVSQGDASVQEERPSHLSKATTVLMHQETEQALLLQLEMGRRL